MIEYISGDEIYVRVVSKEFEPTVLKDTTIGKVYEAVFTEKGDRCPSGSLAIKDSITIEDDIGDTVTFWFSDTTSYELVEQ